MGDTAGAKRPIDELLTKYPVLEACEEEIRSAAQMMIAAYETGGKVLLCGNGGSAADCGHIAGELMKGFLKKRPLDSALAGKIDAADPAGTPFSALLQQGLPAIDLTAHCTVLTASLNDIAGELVFAQQVLGYGKPHDVLIGLSTSGNSGNVVKAFAVAEALGLQTIAMTGGKGGRLGAMARCAIRVPADCTPDVQELHLPVYHALCAAAEAYFFSE